MTKYDQPDHHRGGRNNGQSEGQQRKPDNRVLWFLAIHCGMGVALGVIFASMIVMLNTAGLRDLLMASNEPYIPMFLFYASCALTFGSAKMGVAVMSLPLEKQEDVDRERRERER